MNEIVWILLLASQVAGSCPQFKVFNDTTTLNNFVESNVLVKPQVFVGRKINFSGPYPRYTFLPVEICNGKNYAGEQCTRPIRHGGKHFDEEGLTSWW